MVTSNASRIKDIDTEFYTVTNPRSYGQSQRKSSRRSSFSSAGSSAQSTSSTHDLMKIPKKKGIIEKIFCCFDCSFTNAKSSSSKSRSTRRQNGHNSNRNHSTYMAALQKVVLSTWWSWVYNIFVLVLLFGPAVRDIVASRDQESTFDIIFLLTFTLLLIDIFLRSIVENGYFQVILPTRCSKIPQIGSFLFWCDFLSASMVLFEVELFSPCYFASEDWSLDFESGISSARKISCDRFFHSRLILNILRAARIARFMHTSTILKTSSFQLSQLIPKAIKAIFPISYAHNNAAYAHPCSRLCIQGKSRKKYNFVRRYAACVIQRWWREQLKMKKQLERRQKKKKKSETIVRKRPCNRRSKVGERMKDMTSQHVVLAIFVTAVLTTVANFTGQDLTIPLSMSTLHIQTSDITYRNYSIEIARQSSLKNLFKLNFSDEGGVRYFEIDTPRDTLRERDIVKVTIKNNPLAVSFDVNSTLFQTTYGEISKRKSIRNQGWELLLTTLCIFIIWFIGVFAFAGPLMTLVLNPMDRMGLLLYFMSRDPLGYQNTQRFKRFLKEEENSLQNSGDLLNGMETTFLMSTILRIGSLMKVGFGSAGVDIIRQNLAQTEDNIFLNLGSGTVANCVFLFCDIRKFTDVTECLQEETFVFTNKIASIVHSICNAYDGSANSNIGDAFLLSWTLPNDGLIERTSSLERASDQSDDGGSQADKALLSVIKINIALYHDNHFLEGMSETAKNKLLTKLSDRPGPIVQIGFGLHAGRAVQGAIGTPRKIDATYVSQTVEFAELLESATKRYGVIMLMSPEFYGLLSSTNRRRCRKIDQIRIEEDNEEDDPDDVYHQGVHVRDIYTFDIDVESLYSYDQDAGDDAGSTNSSAKRRGSLSSHSGSGISGSFFQRISRRNSGVNNPVPSTIYESEEGSIRNVEVSRNTVEVYRRPSSTPKLTLNKESPFLMSQIPELQQLILPTGPAICNNSVWLTDEMRIIRKKYSDGLFYPAFKAGLISFYGRDWEDAKQKFSGILERFEDGPSRYFLSLIMENDGVPPKNFVHYTSY